MIELQACMIGRAKAGRHVAETTDAIGTLREAAAADAGDTFFELHAVRLADAAAGAATP